MAPVLVGRDGPVLRADQAIAPGMVGNLRTPEQVRAANDRHDTKAGSPEEKRQCLPRPSKQQLQARSRSLKLETAVCHIPVQIGQRDCFMHDDQDAWPGSVGRAAPIDGPGGWSSPAPARFLALS